MADVTTAGMGKQSLTRFRALGRKVIDIPELGLFLAWLLVMAILGLSTPNFLTPGNMVNIMRDSSILLIVSAGMTIALISGGLDLSVAAVMAIAGVVMGWTYSQGVPMPVALLAGIATGPAIGALNGQLITRARINPLIATLGIMGVCRGLAFIWTDGRTIPIHDAAFRFARAQPLGIPLPIFFMIAVLIVIYYLLGHTKFGQHLYAMGGNADAARQAALNVGHHRRLVYILSASLAALAGAAGSESSDGPRTRRRYRRPLGRGNAQRGWRIDPGHADRRAVHHQHPQRLGWAGNRSRVAVRDSRRSAVSSGDPG